MESTKQSLVLQRAVHSFVAVAGWQFSAWVVRARRRKVEARENFIVVLVRIRAMCLRVDILLPFYGLCDCLVLYALLIPSK